MKTVQVSEEFWKRLRVEAAVRGVTMRSVLEGLGAEWMSEPRPAQSEIHHQDGNPRNNALANVVVRELKVELEE